MASDTVTTTTRPFAEQESALSNLFKLAEGLYSQGPEQFYPGTTIAPQSENTITGQGLALQAVPGIAGLGLGGAQTTSGLMNPNSIFNAASMASLDPNSAQSQAIMSPFISQLQSQILPSIGSNAIQQGAFGGDRQAISQQQAADSTMQAAMDAIVKNQLTGQSLMSQNASFGISSLPTAMSGLLAPSETVSAVGNQQDVWNQAAIDKAVERFSFEQNAPTDALNNLASIITGTNIGGTSTTEGGDGGNDWLNTAGLGLTAASLFV